MIKKEVYKLIVTQKIISNPNSFLPAARFSPTVPSFFSNVQLFFFVFTDTLKHHSIKTYRHTQPTPQIAPPLLLSIETFLSSELNQSNDDLKTENFNKLLVQLASSRIWPLISSIWTNILLLGFTASFFV